LRTGFSVNLLATPAPGDQPVPELILPSDSETWLDAWDLAERQIYRSYLDPGRYVESKAGHPAPGVPEARDRHGALLGVL
jgi:hypothetical protein